MDLPACLARLSPRRIQTHLEDFATSAVEMSFDLFWATNLYMYVPAPLWIASLIKMTSALEIGGYLVTDHFGEDSPSFLPDGLLECLFERMGLRIVSATPPPFQPQCATRILIARRERETEWLKRNAPPK